MTPSLLDIAMPRWDRRRVEDRVIDGVPAEIFPVVMQADFLDAARRNPVVRALFATRAAGERVIGYIRRSAPPVVENPPTLRLADMGDHGDWICLGSDPPHEFVFGVVGQFWAGKTEWQTISADHWSDFDRPGFAKIACTMALHPEGTTRTRVTYEVRTYATDDEARRGFLRYWRVVSPFVGVIMRSMLSVIAQDARHAPHAR